MGPKTVIGPRNTFPNSHLTLDLLPNSFLHRRRLLLLSSRFDRKSPCSSIFSSANANLPFKSAFLQPPPSFISEFIFILHISLAVTMANWISSKLKAAENILHQASPSTTTLLMFFISLIIIPRNCNFHH